MIIFLDIDGVLVHSKSDSAYHPGILDIFDPKCVQILNSLCKKLKAKLVIHSTWKNVHSLEYLRKYFKEQGIEADVLGATSRVRLSSSSKGNEILRWIELNEYKDDYLVVDDDTENIIGVIPEEKFIHVQNGWTAGGLASVDDLDVKVNFCGGGANNG